MSRLASAVLKGSDVKDSTIPPQSDSTLIEASHLSFQPVEMGFGFLY